MKALFTKVQYNCRELAQILWLDKVFGDETSEFYLASWPDNVFEEISSLVVISASGDCGNKDGDSEDYGEKGAKYIYALRQLVNKIRWETQKHGYLLVVQYANYTHYTRAV
jgi:hypothetical protein